MLANILYIFNKIKSSYFLAKWRCVFEQLEQEFKIQALTMGSDCAFCGGEPLGEISAHAVERDRPAATASQATPAGL